MSCPFSIEELEYFDGVVNRIFDHEGEIWIPLVDLAESPMGEACNDCENFECEHNNNDGNPNNWSDGSGEPMTPGEFAENNQKVVTG